MRHRWSTLRLQLDEGILDVPLEAYSYRSLFFADLQRETKARPAADPRHRVVEGRVRGLPRTRAAW